MCNRKKNNIESNDFLGRLTELSKARAADPNGKDFKDINDDNIWAQPVIFFVAGYETTANTLSTTSYNLAKNPEIQVSTLEKKPLAFLLHFDSNQ